MTTTESHEFVTPMVAGFYGLTQYETISPSQPACSG
jgi:hypothetical protein